MAHQELCLIPASRSEFLVLKASLARLSISDGPGARTQSGGAKMVVRPLPPCPGRHPLGRIGFKISNDAVLAGGGGNVLYVTDYSPNTQANRNAWRYVSTPPKGSGSRRTPGRTCRIRSHQELQLSVLIRQDLAIVRSSWDRATLLCRKIMGTQLAVFMEMHRSTRRVRTKV